MDKNEFIEKIGQIIFRAKEIFSPEVLISMLIYIIAAISIAFGVYMILLYMSRFPTKKSQKVLQTVSDLDKGEQQTPINKILGGFSKKFILGLVDLGDSTKYKLQTALTYFNYNVTPEEHFSDAVAAGIMVGALSLMLMIINPFFGVAAFVLGFLIFKSELESPIKKLDKVRQNIDYDSALFCKFVSDALKEENRNVIDILTSCKESVSNDFKAELEHTLTDLKTGNQEEALVAMSQRISTSSMTQIVIGLLGVLRGDNQTLYFEMLYEKFHKEELTRIKKKNSTKAGTISKISMLLIPPVVMMIMVGMILTIVQQLANNGIF